MEWYPTPSYLVKKRVILDFLREIPVKDFLEVGCGAGDLLTALAGYGYRGVGTDISPEALEAARQRLKSGAVSIEQKMVGDVDGVFDVVIASEVLEHCADDVGFLKELAAKVRPGGYLVVTVPAHMGKWGANDEFSGHLRRYEREELRRKMEQAGLEPVCIYSYGVPIYNLMKPFYDRAIGKRLAHDELIEERTRKSSGMWLFPSMKGLFRLLFNDVTMYPFYLLQKLFFKTDLGNGYFAAARKCPDIR
ncbi:MAG: SAM-binding motif-containing [Geobacteraceae bacterium]|nr:MAG: SAM-binding motif-containing [Geobacteraceae bacterium]